MNNISKIIQIFHIPIHLRNKFDIETLMQLTKDIEFFKNLTERNNSNELHQQCCKLMELQIYQPGDEIVSFGDPGDKFYLILLGKAGVFLPEKITIPLKTKKRKKTKSQNSQSSIRSEQSQCSQLEEMPLGRQRRDEIDSSIFNEKLLKKPFINSTIHSQTHLKQLFKPQIEDKNNDWTVWQKVLKSNTQTVVFKQVQTMGQGTTFGELALIIERPRIASIRAKTRVITATLTKQSFNAVIAKQEAKDLNNKIKKLREFPIFYHWTKLSLVKIIYFLKRKNYKRGQKVYSSLDEARFVYFVIFGEFRLYQTKVLETNKLVKESIKPSLLRLGNSRTISKLSEMNIAIKGKNQMIGAEEILKGQAFREFSCECLSSSAQVLFIKKQDFLTRITHPKSLLYMESFLKYHIEQHKQRVKSQNRLQIAKKFSQTHRFTDIKVQKPKLTPIYHRPVIQSSPKRESFLPRKTSIQILAKRNLTPEAFHHEQTQPPKISFKKELKKVPPPNFLRVFRKTKEKLKPLNNPQQNLRRIQLRRLTPDF